MIKVKINDRQTYREIENDLLELIRKVARKSAEIEGYSEGEISIALVDNQQIQVLNNKYRQVDEVTDVLSFPMGDELLGDVIISVERASSQAEDYRHSFAREVCYLVTHGVLHLLGYDHQNPGDKEQMRQKEERILSEFYLGRK